MVVPRDYVRELYRTSWKEFTDNGRKTERSNQVPFTETRLLLAILGCMPCELRRPYWPSKDLRRSSFLYCVVVYSLATYNAACAMATKFRQYEKDDASGIVKRIMNVEQILGLLTHLLGLILWIDTDAISKFDECFMDIQSKFFAATGTELVNRRKKLERLSYVFVTCMPIVFYVITQVCIPVMFVETTTGVALIYAQTILFLVNIYWIGISIRLMDAIDDAKSAIDWQLNKKTITSESIFKFRLLWLSIRAAMDSAAKLHVPAAVHSMIHSLTVVILFEGACFFQINEILAGVGHMGAGAFFSGYFSLACLASDRAQQKMKSFVNDILPNTFLSSYDVGIQREILMLYLSENARPAMLSLRGLTVINKTLVLSFLSNIATYIIVILQFLQKT